MRVDANNLQVVLLDDRLSFRQQSVPDAKAGAWTSDVRLGSASASQTWVETEANLAARARLPIQLELAQAARIQLGSHFDEFLEVRFPFVPA